MGTVVISVDAELGWGHHDLPSPPAERVEYARTGWMRLCSLFEEFDLPATWAVVGHLFLDDCDGEHADHPAPRGWFERERGDWRDRPEVRFGNGLIERVERSGPDHELGCHGFSHQVLGAPETTREMALAEVAASREAAGRDFDSFVFPRNYVAHCDALADSGIECYRGPAPGQADGLARTAQKLAGTPPVVTPHRDDVGLVNVPASLYLFDFEGVPRSLVEPVAGDPVVRRARRGVDAAARGSGVFHAWLHPNNVVSRRDGERLRTVLAHVARRREEGAITVETMSDVAARV